MDGTHIIRQKQHIDGEVFWTRKQSYSIDVQIVCDDLKLVFELSTSFGDSNTYKHPEEYFSNTCLEYLADAGFASESWLCTYLQTTLGINSTQQIVKQIVFFR